MPTISESVENLTGARLPSIPEIELPRPFEYQTEKYKREGNIGEDVGATAIDLLLLKQAIFGKPIAAPESLKTIGGIPQVEAATQTTSATAIATKTEQVAQSQPKPVWKSTPSRTVPSSKTPLEPIGTAEKPLANPKTAKEFERVRGIKRQNEAAEVLAKNGYKVEHQPKIEGTERYRYPWLDPKKNPDFKIEGEIFDAYSPNRNTGMTNVLKAIEKKTIDGTSQKNFVEFRRQ